MFGREWDQSLVSTYAVLVPKMEGSSQSVNLPRWTAHFLIYQVCDVRGAGVGEVWKIFAKKVTNTSSATKAS